MVFLRICLLFKGFFPDYLDGCEISGAMQADPVHGLTTRADSRFSDIGAFDAVIFFRLFNTGCSYR